MKLYILLLLILALILLVTSCAAPPPESGMPEKECPKRELWCPEKIYVYDTQLARLEYIEIYNSLPTTTYKF